MVICRLVTKMIQTVLLSINTAPLIMALMEQFNLKSPFLIHNIFTKGLEYSMDSVKKGLSLTLGSNQCEKCTNDHITLIIPFAVANIALVVFVIDLNLAVSVGTINGLIFYANVVKIYQHIFFLVVPFQFLLSSFSGLILILVLKFVSLMMWILVVRHGFSLSFHPTFGLF